MAKQIYTTGQILTAAQMTTLQANDYNQTVSAKTASYTLVAADVGTRITMNSASATTVTVNTALFAAGDTLEITNIGAGICTVTAGTATVSTSSTLALKEFDSGQLYFTSTGVAIFFASDAADGGSPLTTKGDLFTFSTVDARLPVGTNGEVLVADSSAATGLKWVGPWTTWTPALTNITQGNGTVLARYYEEGKIVFFDFAFTMGSTSSMGSSPNITLPKALKTTTQFADAHVLDFGLVYYSATALGLTGASNCYLQVPIISGTVLANSGISATLPITWGTSDVYRLHGFYEVN